MTFEFGVAGPADDAAIRRLLAENPMPGGVTVAFEREPDYFAGHGVLGDRCITAKAIDKSSGNLAGIVCLAGSNRFVGGTVRPVGYLGQIRIDRRYRGYLLPMRAAAFVRSLAAPDWPDLWFSAIVHDNPVARELFANRSRPTFPSLEPVSDIHTLGLFTRPSKLPGSRTGSGSLMGSGSLAVRRAGDVGLSRAVEFLRANGASREFYPHYETGHFTGEARTPGFAADDLLVAMEGDEIVGVCGVWNQASFKQTVVHGYTGWMRRLRPVINAAGPLLGLKRLPDTGEPLKSATLSFLSIARDNPLVLEALLDAALGFAHGMGVDYLLAGFSVTDPLLPTARRFRHLLYRSTMYAFSFNGPVPAGAFDRTKVPYLEIAAL